MSSPRRNFVAKAIAGEGSRIWNRKQQWWGELYAECPDHLLAELNGERRGVQVNAMLARAKRKSPKRR